METIQPATVDDVEQLAELLAILFTQEADFSPDREKQRRGLQAILASPAVGQIFVARDVSQAGSEILGMLSLLFTVSTAEGGLVCWLEDVVVRPGHRGAGIGTRLLDHAIGYARSSGFHRISLQTDSTNAEAIRFYERHGFRPSEMATLRLQL